MTAATIDAMLREARAVQKRVAALRARTAHLTPSRWLEEQDDAARRTVRELTIAQTAQRVAAQGWTK